MVKTEKLVDLKGGLKHTASSAQIKSDGSLVIELHDFSSEAEKWLGNEVAFLLKVSASEKSKMLSCLLGGQNQMLDESQEDDLLLQQIGERFTDYYEVEQWIEENKIPYEKEFDPLGVRVRDFWKKVSISVVGVKSKLRRLSTVGFHGYTLHS